MNQWYFRPSVVNPWRDSLVYDSCWQENEKMQYSEFGIETQRKPRAVIILMTQRLVIKPTGGEEFSPHFQKQLNIKMNIKSLTFFLISLTILLFICLIVGWTVIFRKSSGISINSSRAASSRKLNLQNRNCLIYHRKIIDGGPLVIPLNSCYLGTKYCLCPRSGNS